MRILLHRPFALLVLALIACQPDQDQEPSAEGEPSPSGAVSESAPSEQGQTAQPTLSPGTSVFTCTSDETESFNFVVTDFNMRSGELALWLPWEFGRPYEVLGLEEGTRELLYSGSGILLELSESTAILSVDDETFEGCTKDHRASIWEHSKLTGVDFRAVGNEPGWHLEIRSDLEARDGKGIRFVYDYGKRDAVLHTSGVEEDRGERRTTYRGENGDLRMVVTIEGIPCQDTMSGEEFESTVTVEFQGRTFRGCGRALH